MIERALLSHRRDAGVTHRVMVLLRIAVVVRRLNGRGSITVPVQRPRAQRLARCQALHEHDHHQPRRQHAQQIAGCRAGAWSKHKSHHRQWYATLAGVDASVDEQSPQRHRHVAPNADLISDQPQPLEWRRRDGVM